MGFFDWLKAAGRAWGKVERGAANARLAAHGWTPEVIGRERERLQLLLAERELQRRREAERFDWARAAEERAAQAGERAVADQEAQRASEAAARRASVLEALRTVIRVNPAGGKAEVGYFSPELVAGMDPATVENLVRQAKGRAETEYQTSLQKAEEDRARRARESAEADARQRGFHQWSRTFDIEHPFPERPTTTKPKPEPGPDAEFNAALSEIQRELAAGTNPALAAALLARGPDGKLSTNRDALYSEAAKRAKQRSDVKRELRAASGGANPNTEPEGGTTAQMPPTLAQYGLTPSVWASMAPDDRKALEDAIRSGEPPDVIRQLLAPPDR